MKKTAKHDRSFIVVCIEPGEGGLSIRARDVMRKVQALVASEIGDSGRCASVATMNEVHGRSFPDDMWASPDGLTRTDIPAP